MTVAVIKHVINIVSYGKRQSFVNFAAKTASKTRKILSRLNNNFGTLYSSINLLNPN